VCLRTALRRKREPVTDLDAFHGLRAHQRGRQPCVEPLVLRRVGAETRRDVVRSHFDDAADGVAFRASLVHSLLQVVAEHAALDVDAELAEQRLRDCARRDDHGGVPCARALERVANVGEPELQSAGEIRVARARQSHFPRSLAARLSLRRPRAHPPLPVRVVAVADDERERRPEGASVSQSREDVDLVLLDSLPRAAAVALLTPAEIGVDRLLLQRQPGREPGDDRDERRPMRLAGSGQAQHEPSLLRANGREGPPKRAPSSVDELLVDLDVPSDERLLPGVVTCAEANAVRVGARTRLSVVGHVDPEVD
jgi:hypothetical protein